VWVNPKYADQVSRPRPPAETGRRLAAMPRGEGAEMRVVLDRYQDRPYVSLRLWERDRDGEWWPVKGKGCSVRTGEVAELIAALRQVEDILDRRDDDGRDDPPRPAADPDRPRYNPRHDRRTRGHSVNPDDLSPPASGFDEFSR
jgi:hypothetical protein